MAKSAQIQLNPPQHIAEFLAAQAHWAAAEKVAAADERGRVLAELVDEEEHALEREH